LVSYASSSLANNPTAFSLSRGGIVYYVGGDGPNNYTSIQEAVSHAAQGDSVFVYDDSSPYYEHVTIDKSLHLIGENKSTTVIDGGNIGDVVVLSADNITMEGFTVQNSGDTPKKDAGIESRAKGITITGNSVARNGRYAIGIFLNGSSHNLVSNNFISENGNEGVFLEKSTDCIIQHNLFTRNGHCAIVISQSQNNTIIQNTIDKNYAGISLWPESMKNEISHNIIQNQEYSGVGIWSTANNNIIDHNYINNNSLYGILITRAQGTVIMNNTIQGSNDGVRFDMANKTIIRFNNFIENNNSAFFENSSWNRWKQNYWDDHPWRWPKCIKGLMRIPWNKSIVIHWINLDWFPETEPYDIPIFSGDFQ